MGKQSGHEKAPGAGTPRASDNEFNYQEENVMTNNSTAMSNVIPFDFESKPVRTVLINGEPWFAAKDVISGLGYASTSAPARVTAHVPTQWKGLNRIHTPGGTQELLMLSEQGLYFFLGRSDKPKALPFQMWLAGEVLPSIRKHGRHEDSAGRMTDLVNAVIGSSGLVVLDRVIDQKAAAVDKGLRRSFKLTMKSRLRGRFNVPRTELIPADNLADACNFVAAYALEGEWLGKQESGVMTPEDLYGVYVLTCHFKALYDIFKDYRMYDALKALGSRAGIEMIDHFKDGHHQAFILLQNYGEAMDAYQREKGLNQYRGRVVA